LYRTKSATEEVAVSQSATFSTETATEKVANFKSATWALKVVDLAGVLVMHTCKNT
jgi:hypothetical protein